MTREVTDPERNPMNHWSVWVVGNVVEAVEASNRGKWLGYKAYCVDGITTIEVGYCRKSEAFERAEVFGQVIDASAP